MTAAPPELFDPQRLRELVAPAVRQAILAPGALEGLVVVLHVASLARSALARLDVPPELIARVETTAPATAEAVAELRAFLEAQPE